MKKGNGTDVVTIDCSVSLGMFRDERGVRVELPSGREVSAIVHRRFVSVDQELQPGEEVPGRVRVFIVSTKGRLATVDLPQPGLTDGPRLQVPKNILRPATA